MPAAAHAPTARKVGDMSWLAAGFHISVLIIESDDGIGVRDIDILRRATSGIEGDPEWLAQALGENLRAFNFSVFVLAKHSDAAGLTLGDEEIAARRGGDLARIGQA